MPVRKASKPSSPAATPAPAPKTKAASAAPDVAAAKAAPAAEAAAPASSPATASATAPAVAEVKSRKPKLVRDSFTIPKDEYAALDGLKLRAAQQGHVVKKSELLRAGLKLLAGLDEPQLLAALKAVPSIKTGRPAKAQEAAASDRAPERAPARSRKAAKAS